ncbi:Zn-ribbon domain-containing OB-fold protein [Nocardioides limicola]|uniref:Zn-ribbon domain-containing OB-fold protein n=1 Tax=Nocardioides limicola TaxID=2803368 RepID=UPI00193C8060|nr:OB-fold domain-containing protein [Nocardioides sp. DJM-14]
MIERDHKSAAFFDAAAEDRLVIRRCIGCRQALPPEAVVCTTCAGTDLEWVQAEGTGLLASYTVVHRAPHPAYRVPYTIGVVELDEGPWLYARVNAESPTVGLPVRVAFRHPEEGESFPVFEEVPA